LKIERIALRDCVRRETHRPPVEHEPTALARRRAGHVHGAELIEQREPREF
jgi:hypothetical protein